MEAQELADGICSRTNPKNQLIVKALIKFAEFHVTEALSKVVDAGIDGITHWSGNPYTGEGDNYLSEDKIMHDLYPTKCIK